MLVICSVLQLLLGFICFNFILHFSSGFSTLSTILPNQLSISIFWFFLSKLIGKMYFSSWLADQCFFSAIVFLIYVVCFYSLFFQMERYLSTIYIYVWTRKHIIWNVGTTYYNYYYYYHTPFKAMCRSIISEREALAKLRLIFVFESAMMEVR